jgi:hypothetical protein
MPGDSRLLWPRRICDGAVPNRSGWGRGFRGDRVFFSALFFPSDADSSHPFQVPPAIDLSIRKSFRLVFCDPGAAANHIRQCAETILATAGIAHVTETGKFIPFEQRIQKFEDIDPENADRVSALRWIGNFGSHPDKEITRDDVFEAYDILEILLEDLYVGHTKSVRKRVEEINKARGPR